MCSYIIQPCMHASNHPTTPSTRYDILGKSTGERGKKPGADWARAGGGGGFEHSLEGLECYVTSQGRGKGDG